MWQMLKYFLSPTYNKILDVLRSLVDPPPNESLEDLSFSELEFLFQNFMELNTPFFAMAAVASQFLTEHDGTKSEKIYPTHRANLMSVDRTRPY